MSWNQDPNVQRWIARGCNTVTDNGILRISQVRQARVCYVSSEADRCPVDPTLRQLARGVQMARCRQNAAPSRKRRLRPKTSPSPGCLHHTLMTPAKCCSTPTNFKFWRLGSSSFRLAVAKVKGTAIGQIRA